MIQIFASAAWAAPYVVETLAVSGEPGALCILEAPPNGVLQPGDVVLGDSAGALATRGPPVQVRRVRAGDVEVVDVPRVGRARPGPEDAARRCGWSAVAYADNTNEAARAAQTTAEWAAEDAARAARRAAELPATSPYGTVEVLEATSSDGVPLRVRVVRAPDSDRVLLVVGAPERSHHPYEPLERLVSAGWTVATYDPRGTGLSGRPTGERYGLWSRVADVEAVRVALGAEPLVVLAHQRGCATAARWASEHPESVRGWIGVDCGPASQAPSAAVVVVRPPAPAPSQAEPVTTPSRPEPPPPPAGLDPSCHAAWPGWWRRHPERLDGASTAGTCHPLVERALSAADARFDVRAAAASIQAPTLLVSEPGRAADWEAALPPGHVRVDLAGCGAFPMGSCAPAFDAALLAVETRP